MALSFAYKTQPANGQTQNGDTIFHRQAPSGELFAVIDGLGHGPEASSVAQKAAKYISQAPPGTGVDALFSGLHRVLHGTRGVAALLFLVQDTRLIGASVGNVELRSFGTALPIVLTPGVVGQRLPKLRVFEGALSPRTRLLAYSDGISNRFIENELSGLSREQACEHLMTKHRKAQDDASILVIDIS